MPETFEVVDMDEKINLYEMLGILTGDGCMRYYPHKSVYGIEIAGNADDEVDYFEKMSIFFVEKFQKQPRIFVRYVSNGKGLKLMLHGKQITEFFINLGIKPAKTYTAEIPLCVKEWEQAKYFIRGLFETDGSLYFSKSKKINYPSHPRLEIKTASPQLAIRFYNLLASQKYPIQFRHDGITSRVYPSGSEMLERLANEIGFNSEKNNTKHLLWKQLGFYVPKISLLERKSMLKKHSQILAQVL